MNTTQNLRPPPNVPTHAVGGTPLVVMQEDRYEVRGEVKFSVL